MSKSNLTAYSCDQCHKWIGDPLHDRWQDFPLGMEWLAFLGHDFCGEACAQTFVNEAFAFEKEQIRHAEETRTRRAKVA